MIQDSPNKHGSVLWYKIPLINKSRRGRDLMVVEITTTCVITTKVVSPNSAHGEVYSIQFYVIKFVKWLATGPWISQVSLHQ
jgi:hypothetical protein